MSLVTSIRNQQTNLIAQNTTTAVITRTTKTSDGVGGYTTSDSTLVSQDIRIYNKKTRVLNIDTGGWSTKRIIKGIAKYDADINPETATNKDVFSFGCKSYVIKDVRDIYCQENIVFKELEIEEI